MEDFSNLISRDLDFLGDIITVFNKNFDLIYINKKSEGILGIPTENLKNQKNCQIFHPNDRQTIKNISKNILKAGYSEATIRVRSKDGNYKWLEIRMKTTKNKNGETRIIAVGRNITPRKKLEKKLEKKLRKSEQKPGFTKDDPEVQPHFKAVQGKEPANFEITEIINPQTLKEINEAFANTFDVTMLLTDPEGGYIVGPDNLSEFCQIIRSSKKGLEGCISSDQILAKRAKCKSEPIINHCSNAGLIDAVLPIIINGRHVASWLVGQFCPSEATENTVRQTALKVGEDERKLLKAYHKLKKRPIQQLEKTLNLLEIFAQELSKYGLKNLELAKANIERKKAEEKLESSREMLEKVIDTSPTGITIVNKEGKIIYANSYAEKILRITKEEIISRTHNDARWDIKDFNGNPFPNEKLPFEEVKRTKKPVFNVRHSIKTSSGETRLLSINAAPLFDSEGGFHQVICNFNDVTAEIKTLRKLKKSTRELKESLNKTEFYKDLLSHDMANVLNNTKTSVQLMELWKDNPSKIEEKEVIIDIITQQIERGASLISNVRKLSQVEKGVCPIRSMNIETILKNAISNIKTRFHRKDLNIRIDFSDKNVKVKGGKLLLNAFENILQNGCIHNENKTIKLYIKINKVRKKDKDWVKLEFRDNADGIKDERKDIIFERSYDKEKSRGGMGIGLMLVKEIINGYGGRVWVEDRVKGDYSRGSNFIVFLREAK